MSSSAATRWRQCGPVRAWRGVRPDRNPLRRRSDRVETGVLAGLLAAFLVLAPIVTLLVANIVYRAGERTQDRERTARTPAVARLLGDAGPVTSGPSWAWQVRTPATWRARDGRTGTGTVLAPPGARAGSTVSVWVNGAGRLVGGPISGGAVTGLALGAGAGAVVLLGALLATAAVMARRVLMRRRLAGWDVAWSLAARR